MRSPIQVLVAMAVLLAAATVFAQVYRWVDKDGKVHYTDTPPPKEAKGEARKVNTSPASATSDGLDRAKTTADNNKAADKRRSAVGESSKKSDEENKRLERNAEVCSAAKRNLALQESGRPMSSSNEKGELSLMSDTERELEMKRTREVIAEACK